MIKLIQSDDEIVSSIWASGFCVDVDVELGSNGPSISEQFHWGRMSSYFMFLQRSLPMLMRHSIFLVIPLLVSLFGVFKLAGLSLLRVIHQQNSEPLWIYCIQNPQNHTFGALEASFNLLTKNYLDFYYTNDSCYTQRLKVTFLTLSTSWLSMCFRQGDF